jgi:hypothetical protein
MTQEECLASPHHFVHENVCSPGTVAWIQLSSVENPQPATFTTNGVTSVPEPGTSALFALALAMGAVSLRIRTRRGTKLG